MWRALRARNSSGGGINIKAGKIAPRGDKTHNKILFVGRDFTRKGGAVTVEAFRLLRQSRPEAELYVAGPKYDPVGAAVEGYHFLGDLSHDELQPYFNNCDIFCMPSYFEAYGLVFIEALCSGLPCIGRDCFEMPYMIEDGVTGRLLRDDSPQTLAGIMDSLLDDDCIRANVAARQPQYIEQYSWEAVAKRCVEAMEKQRRQ